MGHVCMHIPCYMKHVWPILISPGHYIPTQLFSIQSPINTHEINSKMYEHCTVHYEIHVYVLVNVDDYLFHGYGVSMISSMFTSSTPMHGADRWRYSCHTTSNALASRILKSCLYARFNCRNSTRCTFYQRFVLQGDSIIPHICEWTWLGRTVVDAERPETAAIA